MQHLQRLMIGNGFLVLVVALLAGFMLGFGLIGGFEVFPGVIMGMPYYGTPEGWARAHTGGLTNGLMVLAVALALPLVPLSARMLKVTAYGIIYVAWANTIFYWLGNAAASRSLSFGDNPIGETSFVGVLGLSFAFVGVFVALWVLINAALRSLSAR